MDSVELVPVGISLVIKNSTVALFLNSICLKCEMVQSTSYNDSYPLSYFSFSTGTFFLPFILSIPFQSGATSGSCYTSCLYPLISQSFFNLLQHGFYPHYSIKSAFWGVDEMGEGGQKVQTPSYKTDKSWDVMHSMVTVVNNTVLYI